MNSDWQWIQLGEISEVISKGTTPTTHGVAFTNSGIPFLRAEDVVGGAVDITSVKYFIDEKTHNTLLSRSQLQPGDFLITIAGSLGRVGYVPLNAPPLNCNQAVAFVRLKPNTIDLDFLLYVFQFEGITKSLLDVQKVGTIGNLNLEQIRDFKIPLPPLTEQKRIASLLARADRLRGMRRTAHDLGESLLQSVFLEMFGDPETNPNDWEVVDLQELTRLITDGTHVTPTYLPSGIPFISTVHVSEKGIDWDNAKYISLEEHRKLTKRCKPEVGDILYTKVGSVGLALPVPDEREFSIFVQLALIKIKKELCNLYYLVQYLNMPQVRNPILAKLTGATMKYIGVGDIGEIKVILPPLSLQEEFAGVVARVESLRGRMSESERQVEGLFESLLAQSFDGGQ